MDFSFSETAGASQSSIKPQLTPNKIHEVKLTECKKEDIAGVKDPTAVYKVIKINFENEDGYYQHTFFEPRPEDTKRGEQEDKKGGKFPTPSNVESMMLFFKHVLDAFVPAVANKIDSGELVLGAKNWDDLRDLMIKLLSKSGDKTSKIKLIKTSKGDTRLPGFFASINKEGKAYIRNNFIGDKIAFTAYEINRINNEEKASQANVSSPASSSANDNLDLDFNVDDL